MVPGVLPSAAMDKRFFDDLAQRLGEAFRSSPAADIEKNIKALLASAFDRLELVTREDFEVQKRLLERAQAKLADLESRLDEIERKTRL
jgi:BMFP domain-containing protein YqiC